MRSEVASNSFYVSHDDEDDEDDEDQDDDERGHHVAILVPRLLEPLPCLVNPLSSHPKGDLSVGYKVSQFLRPTIRAQKKNLSI